MPLGEAPDQNLRDPAVQRPSNLSPAGGVQVCRTVNPRVPRDRRGYINSVFARSLS